MGRRPSGATGAELRKLSDGRVEPGGEGGREAASAVGPGGEGGVA